MRKHQKWAVGFALYAVVAIVTFGHAAAAAERADVVRYQQCVEREEVCIQGIPGINGFMAAVFWPFYWSWEAFK